MNPRPMAVTKSEKKNNNKNNGTYIYTYTHMSKVEAVQQKESTED